MNEKIAIQGFEGSFHHEASRRFFGTEVIPVPCATFRETVKTASDRSLATGGLMAIENSIAGSILPNYNLLQKSTLHVIGEIYLQINQNLLVNPGVTLNDIKEVHSHPMAFLQCMDYLETHTWKLIETEDTALSAKHLHQHHHRHAAAIAGKLAAKMFGLDILVPNIHSLRNNYTRFLALRRKEHYKEPEDGNKASVYFRTDHTRGSLARVLSRIAERGVNLSKLQSFPIPGSDWKYFFHADLEFDGTSHFYNVLERIQKITSDLKVYGVYKQGKKESA